MDKILMDSSGKIWVDASNKIIKTRPFSETTLPNGKVCEYIAGNFNNISGYAQSWYDSVGSNHLYQNTAANQLLVRPDGSLYANDNADVRMKFTSNFDFKSLFIVADYTVYGVKNSGRLSRVSYGGPVNISKMTNGTVLGEGGIKTVVNNVVYTLGTAKTAAKFIIYTEFGTLLTYLASGCFLGHTLASEGFPHPYYHISFYNRALNDAEINYNTVALATKYGISL